MTRANGHSIQHKPTCGRQEETTGVKGRQDRGGTHVADNGGQDPQEGTHHPTKEEKKETLGDKARPSSRRTHHPTPRQTPSGSN